MVDSETQKPSSVPTGSSDYYVSLSRLADQGKHLSETEIRYTQFDLAP